jgi:hypothetical protein
MHSYVLAPPLKCIGLSCSITPVKYCVMCRPRRLNMTHRARWCPVARQKGLVIGRQSTISSQDAYFASTIEAPSIILALARHHDASAIPVLEEALTSQNDLVRAAGARGLAELNDAKAIPKIIKACQESPRESASVIAQALVYFDDPEAQRAVDQYVPKAMAKALRDARANEKASPYR